ncbi:hypothetical protein [Ureaplasma ceti]|uniref:Sigma-70 family RNA polymerase sigma factor n=1 Tax=Ureaplasma ceti TaxID=3119530 RepID=A0ABP9U6N3_9BACT
MTLITLSEPYTSAWEQEINRLYSLYHDSLVNLAHYIIRHNLYYLNFHADDLECEVLASIKQLRKINPTTLEKYGTYNVLKKIFVRNIIGLNRHYLTYKHRILTTCYNEGDCNHSNLMAQSICPHEHFNLHFDYEMVMHKLQQQLKNTKAFQTFELYLHGKKVQEITQLTHLNKKQVYNHLANIKRYLQTKFKREFFN